MEVKEGRKKRIVRMLSEVEREMNEIKLEEIGGKTEKLQWMNWGEFVVCMEMVEDIGRRLEHMWFYPYPKEKEKESVGFRKE